MATPKILIVSTFCRNDLELIKQRATYLQKLGQLITNDLLLVYDVDVLKEEAEEVVKLYQPFFRQITLRKIMHRDGNGTWPQTVNHAWRTTAKIVAGQYGEVFKAEQYMGWFYFEPDVTPISKEWIGILEQNYFLFRKPFMGAFTVAEFEETGRDGKVRMMRDTYVNGAAIYPIMTKYYNQGMMLDAANPWDRHINGITLNKSAEIPRNVYRVDFNSSQYHVNGEQVAALNRNNKTFEFTLKGLVLHHGCKDGSLMRELFPVTVPDQSSEQVKTESISIITNKEGEQTENKIELIPLPPRTKKRGRPKKNAENT